MEVRLDQPTTARDGAPAGGPAGGGGPAASAGMPSAASTTGIELRLIALRHLMKVLLLAQRGSWLAAAALASAIGWGVVDYVIRAPGWLRGVVLAGGLATLGVLAYRRLMPVARFAPGLADLALRLERSPDGVRENLPGRLASGLELAGSGLAAVQPMVRESGERIARLTPFALLRLGPTVAAGAALGLAVLVFIGMGAARPTLTAIGVRRVLLPWTEAAWPKRAALADVTGASVHPLGTALPLRAALVSPGADAEAARVEARYRLIDDAGAGGPVRRVVLTSQGKPVEVPASSDPLNPRPGSGALMERLLEPAALEVDAQATSREAVLEYWFESDDDQTAARRVTLVRPPRVIGATATIEPPAYARGLGISARTAELGPGIDERATVGDVLAGSRVELAVALSKPIPMPAGVPARALVASVLGEAAASAVLDGERAGTADAAAGAASGPASGVVRFEDQRWVLEWTARGSVTLRPAPVDQYGIEADAEAAYRVEVRADRVPEAVVLEPGEDVEVLPTASVPVRVEGRDDLGLARVAAESRLARKRAGTESAAVEPVDAEPAVLAEVVPGADAGREATAAARLLTASATLDLPGLHAKAGDEFWITAVAADTFELDGVRHEPVRSAVRKVKVISPEQLAEQVWAELGAVRRSAINLAEQQDRLGEAVEKQPPAANLSRDQQGVTEGVQRQQQGVERLGERVRKNNLANDELAGVLEQARDLLEQARNASQQAQQALRNAEQEQKAERADEAGKAREQARQAQAGGQRALEDLAAMLDQGQDAWSARRGVERLKREQQSLRDQTAKLGQQTVGRKADELTAGERAQAAQIAQQHEDLGQRAQDAVDKLRQQAEQLRERDAATAQALEQAAARAERAQVAEQISRISEQVRQNRQQAANQQQDQVLRALDQVLEQMDQAGRDRDERLSRELASVIESIQGLIARQKQEIDALDVAGGQLGGLDTRLIALRTQTLGVADQARSAGREMAGIAREIEQAATAQAEAIGALRAEPADAAAARDGETKALGHLEKAAEDAQKSRQQAQDRSTRRQRGELRRAYAELLGEQTDLRARTADVANLEAGRRQRAAARELSQPQEDLRRKASELLTKTKDLGQSELFRFAHERLDAAQGKAASTLGEGQAGAGVTAAQTTAVRVLQSLIDALGDLPQDKDPFRDQEAQGGGGGGGGGGPNGLIPPTAELRLLRIMQEEALGSTREVEKVGDEAARRAALVEAGRLQGDLAERAEALLKKLKQEQRPGGMKMPGGGGGEQDGGEKDGGAKDAGGAGGAG